VKDQSEQAFWDGSEKMKRRAWAEAAEDFQRAEQLGYRSALLPLNLGEAFVKSGQIDKAVLAYEEMVEDDPYMWGQSGRAYPHYFLGAALACAGRHLDALKHLEESLRMRPQLVEAQGALAVVLASLGRHEESKRAFERALALLPSYLERWPVAFEGDFFFTIDDIRKVYDDVLRRCQEDAR